MSTDEVNLASVFQSVTQALSENQQNLNAADGYNGDHGANMVQTFQTITSALQKKQANLDSAALSYAAKQLSKKAASGSGKLYAEHLSEAASHFKGKPVDSQPGGGGDLLGMLMGGLGGRGGAAQQNEQPAGGDLLGSLFGGMGGGQQTTQQGGGGDLLGSLLGGLGGGQQSSQTGGGGDLLGSLLGG